MSTRPVLAGAIVALVVFASTTLAYAQAPVVPPLEGGDVAWAFANEDPLFDGRVAGALGTLMAPLIEASAPDGIRIVRVEPNGPDVQSATIYPYADVPKLLEAAGFDPVAPFIQVGACRYWTPDATDGVSWASPVSPAAVVVDALGAALESLGLPDVTCSPVDDPASAHLLFWIQGDTPPALPQRDTPTFLAGSGTPNAPSTPPGPGVAPSAPQPTSTGNGGPAARPAAAGRVPQGALLISMAVLALTARLVTKRRGSR